MGGPFRLCGATPRRPAASDDPGKAEPRPQPQQHTHRLDLLVYPHKVTASPLQGPSPPCGSAGHFPIALDRISYCFTTRARHHGCLTPRPPPFQPPTVLPQDTRISPATTVFRRAILRKWHPTIIPPSRPASPAAPTLAASHNGPGRADEHGGAEEICQG